MRHRRPPIMMGTRLNGMVALEFMALEIAGEHRSRHYRMRPLAAVRLAGRLAARAPCARGPSVIEEWPHPDRSRGRGPRLRPNATSPRDQLAPEISSSAAR